MPAWWGVLSTVIVPPIFIVILVVLWMILRRINGVFTILTYTHEKITNFAEALDMEKRERELAREADREAGRTGRQATRSRPAPGRTAASASASRSGPTDMDDRIFYLAETNDPEQLKEEIITLLREGTGLGYGDLAEQLGVGVNRVKALCAELEDAGAIAGR